MAVIDKLKKLSRDKFLMNFPGVERAEIDDKLITGSYKHYFILSFGEFLGILLYSFFLWTFTSNHFPLAIWLAATLIFNALLRGVFLLSYHRQKKQGSLRHPAFWKNYFIINSLQSGIFWALGGLLFIYIDDPLHRMVILFYLTGLLGGAAPVVLTFHLAYLGFIIPVGVVMIFLSLSITPSLSFILSCGIMLYVAIVLFASAKVHQLLVKSFYLELYNSNVLSDLKRSEESFRNTIENAPIGMAIISPEGKCIHANRTLQELLGYTLEELRYKDILEITHPDDIPMTKDAMDKLIHRKLRVCHLEKRYFRKDGSLIWVMVSISLIRDEEGKPLHFITQMKDVSDRIQNEEKMRLLNEKTMTTLNELQLLQHDESLLNKLNRSLQVCVLAEEAYPRINLIAQDLFPELSGGLSVFNKPANQLETVIQWGKDQLLPKVFFPMDCFAIRESAAHIVDDPEKAVPCDHYITLPQGGYAALTLVVQNELIGVFHLIAPKGKKLTQHQQDMAASFSNVVKLALANINLRASLNELSLRDPLTSLYNRRYLNDILSRELIRIAREKNKLCVAMLDIDNFKKFNDTYSHLAGDEALKLIGQLLTEGFRGSDIAFRFGGEEFVVVLLNTTLNNAVTKLDQFREKLKNTPINYKNTQLPKITISIGVSEAPQHGVTINDILKAADNALYAAKKAGKDRVIDYSKSS
ncbi:sensor domain-containing diguanylate cyclase [Legionella tucsonensis]|uniref:diguanylate cyclase n=1 Tax=Legionella tucsonensis TaxID=40335 RepID=A0A0W0ZS00_9GAMM|nr:sensor domain-containing diguanylate cyclase [Legionella tucsonensis]KTD71969.1 regulatory protein (GGDEF, PAS, PAC domains) [Legionella tucsonensis]